MLLDVAAQHLVQLVVRRQGVLIGLVLAELRRRWTIENARGDQLAPTLPVEPAGQRVHRGLGQIADGGEPSRHVAVERAEPGGQLALVSRRQQQGARLVRERHQQHPADARLEVFLGHVRLAAGEERRQGGQVRLEDRLDGDGVEPHSEPLRERLRVFVAHRRRIPGRHCDGGHVLRTQCARGEHRREGGVDSPGEPEHRALESRLQRVVADAERERVGQVAAGLVGEVRLVRRHDRERSRRGLRGLIGDHRLSGSARSLASCTRCAGDELVDDEILAEGGGLTLHFTVRAHEQRATVEDQGVVASDQIAHRDREPVPARRGAQHPAPDLRLAHGVGRGGDVDDHLRSSRDQLLDGVAQVPRLLPELLVVPEVLADGDAQPRSRHLDQRSRLRRGIEVATFVEDVVRRQQALPDDGGDATALDESDGVVQAGAGAPVALGKSNQRRNAIEHGIGRQLLQHGPATIDELTQLEEVFRRVAAERELGKEHELRALFGGPGRVLQHAGSVRLERAYRRVDLRQRDSHAGSVTPARSRVNWRPSACTLPKGIRRGTSPLCTTI